MIDSAAPQASRWSPWVTGAWFQAVWLLCVGRHEVIAALTLVLGVACLLRYVPRFSAGLVRSVVVSVALGFMHDHVLVAAGIFRFVDGPLGSIGSVPFWMVMLWCAFAVTLPRLWSPLRSRWFLAAILGGVVFPLNYHLGVKLGGGEWLVPVWVGAPSIGLFWCVFFPLLLRVAIATEGGAGILGVVLACMTLIPPTAKGNPVDSLELWAVGVASHIESGVEVYQERHYQNRSGDRAAVRYVGSNGEVWVDKWLDYSVAKTTPEMVQIDYRTGKVIRIGYRGDQPGGRDQLELAEYLNTTLKSADLMSMPPGSPIERAEKRVPGAWVPVPQDAVVDAGFDPFVRIHWESLLTGKGKRFPFLVQTRQRFIDLMARRIDRESSDVEQIAFEVQVANPVLRWWVEPLKLVYSANDKRLLRFEGVTNIPKLDGDPWRLRIDYRYP